MDIVFSFVVLKIIFSSIGTAKEVSIPSAEYRYSSKVSIPFLASKVPKIQEKFLSIGTLVEVSILPS